MQAPGEAVQNYQKSRQFAESGEPEEAERYLKKALDQDPSNANYHFELANLYAQRYDSISKKGSHADMAAGVLESGARPKLVWIMTNLMMASVRSLPGNRKPAMIANWHRP